MITVCWTSIDWYDNIQENYARVSNIEEVKQILENTQIYADSEILIFSDEADNFLISPESLGIL